MFKSVDTVIGYRIPSTKIKDHLTRNNLDQLVFHSWPVIFDEQENAFICAYCSWWSDGMNMHGKEQLQLVVYQDNKAWDAKSKLEALLDPLGLWKGGQFGLWTIVRCMDNELVGAGVGLAVGEQHDSLVKAMPTFIGKGPLYIPEGCGNCGFCYAWTGFNESPERPGLVCASCIMIVDVDYSRGWLKELLEKFSTKVTEEMKESLDFGFLPKGYVPM